MRLVRTAAIFAAVVTLVTAAPLTASADPGFVPDANDIVLVGEETSELVLNDLAALDNARTPTPSARLASFNATGSSTITLRAGTPATNRWRTSDSAIQALCSNPNISAARSSRGPSRDDCAGLAFLPFAKDYVRWAANSSVNGVTSLTDAQLTGIYNCTITNWNQVGGPNLTIKPFIPRAEAEPRRFWANQVLINALTLPACVKDNVGGVAVEPNSTVQLGATAGAILPISAGRYGLLTATEKSGTFLGAIPTPDSNAYDRNLYNVVRTRGGVIAANGFVPLGDAVTGGTCGVQ